MYLNKKNTNEYIKNLEELNKIYDKEINLKKTYIESLNQELDFLNKRHKKYGIFNYYRALSEIDRIIDKKTDEFFYENINYFKTENVIINIKNNIDNNKLNKICSFDLILINEKNIEVSSKPILEFIINDTWTDTNFILELTKGLTYQIHRQIEAYLNRKNINTTIMYSGINVSGGEF